MPVTTTSLGPGETRVAYMIGRAAEDVKDGSVELRIIVPQLNPAASGAVEPGAADTVIETMTPDGTPEQRRAKTTNVITATYHGQSNIKYRPTVRKGEQVLITQYGDSDRYFWESLGRDPELRQLDVYRVEVSDKTTLSEELTDDNTYLFELNTKTGQVTIKTAKTNGEQFRYMVQIDAKNGTLLIGDDAGNSAFINSVESQVRLANAKGSMLDLNGLDAMLVAPRDLVMKAGRQAAFDAPMLTNQNTGGVTKMTAGALALDATSAVVITAPMIGLNGQVSVGGSLQVGGTVLAENYATGTASPYAASDTDIVEGTSNIASNTPGIPAAGPEARHAAAHEQLVELTEKIAELFGEVFTAVGAPTTDADTVLTPIAEASIMSKNTGE